MQPDIKVVAQAQSLAEARDHAAKFELDVVILDVGLPDGNGVDLIADLRRANPHVRVLILSASLDAENFERATEADADEIVDKFAPMDEVLATIRRLGST
jgi:two-component system KDP operon response regulator KdpE